MPRRVNLPGVEEFFGGPQPEPASAAPDRTTPTSNGPTGRVRHDEKITVYVSTDELIGLESARLRLRAEFGLGVDRGRLVRAAIDLALDDLAANGAAAAVVQRLQQ